MARNYNICMFFHFRTVAISLFALTALAPLQAQIYHAAEMNTEQLRGLDRAKTVVIIPGGILEEHGPYIPSYTDGFVADRLAQEVANSIVEHGWTVLFMPPIPLGSGGANELAGKYPFPGTYAVRVNTLRAVYMDLADELGEAGFKWIFLVHTHGAPNHNRILDQAGAYFAEAYNGKMVHLTGFGIAGDDPHRTLTDKAKQEDAGSGHAGIDETSEILFLRPDLVDPAYKGAKSFPAPGGDTAMIRVSKQPDWPGYFGAPQYSSAEFGAKLFKSNATRMTQQALAILDGAAPQNRPRGGPRPVDQEALSRDSAREQKQHDWLKKNGYE